MAERITITAVRHSCRSVPIWIPVAGLLPDLTSLKDIATGRESAVQSDGDAYCFLLGSLDKGEAREYETICGSSFEDGVSLRERAGEVDFLVNGALFTTYHYSEEFARPFLHPVIGPEGARVTRGFPMEQGIRGETTDHPHHRSIWVAHGDVNGVDNWSENEGHGKTVHRAFTEKTSGPVFARIRALNDWVDNLGKKVLEEERTITVYACPEDARFVDFEILIRATEGDVKFGDTKEGGIISVRVATSMDGNKGGLITNSFGGVTEAENWGKRAHWCDYSGPVDGRTLGITIFDHPDSFRHPTNWHVRNYGLMTANPFALRDYSGDPSRDGSHVLKSGEVLKSAFRLYIHEGSAEESRVGEQYHGYINPPVAEVQ